MKTYQDKKTGKWKIGSNGSAIYDSEKDARKAGLEKLIDRIWDLNRRRNEAVS